MIWGLATPLAPHLSPPPLRAGGRVKAMDTAKHAGVHPILAGGGGSDAQPGAQQMSQETERE